MTGVPQAGARIDPAQVQIVFADLQPSLIGGSRTVPPDTLARNVAALAEVARLLELPTLFSIAPQGDTAPRNIDALTPYAKEGTTISRPVAGAFLHEPTARAIASADRPVIVVAGFAAEVVVLQTVLDARAASYDVHYVADGIGGLSDRSEAAAFRAMEQAGAHPTSVVSLIARLAPDFSGPPGTDVLKVMTSVMAR